MPEPRFDKFTGAKWIVGPLNKIREWIIHDRLIKVPGLFRDTGAGWEIIPRAVATASATTWAFEPYFVLDDDDVQQLRIREGLVNPGNLMPTLVGTALDADPLPESAGKETGTVSVWLLIEHDLQTEEYYSLVDDDTRYRAASGGDMLAATVEFTGSSGTPPAGVRAGVYSDTAGTVSQTPKFAIQVNTITEGVPQTQNVCNVNRPLFIKFCPEANYQPFPM